MGWFRKINKNGEDYKPIGNVITATSLSVAGPVLADGDVVRVMFTTDIVGSDTSTPLALTWNGGASPIPVKVAKEGSLASVYAHEVATNIFKYISGYVTLEMAFDGTNFVIIGNPVVLSGAGYTIYANGQSGQMVPDYASGSIYTSEVTSYTMPCNGFINFAYIGLGGVRSLIIDGVKMGYDITDYGVSSFSGFVSKGSVITLEGGIPMGVSRLKVFKLIPMTFQ